MAATSSDYPDDPIGPVDYATCLDSELAAAIEATANDMDFRDAYALGCGLVVNAAEARG